jgi:hypothetical protein
LHDVCVFMTKTTEGGKTDVTDVGRFEQDHVTAGLHVLLRGSEPVWGADEGSEAPAAKLSPTVLPGTRERFHSTRGRRKLDLPEH